MMTGERLAALQSKIQSPMAVFVPLFNLTERWQRDKAIQARLAALERNA
jgi:hypothetical protein